MKIIYEDSDIIVCHKPAGIATQTKRLGQQDMEHLLKNYRAKKGETPYIGVVHRLDQPVEGVMVFAKNQKAAASLSRQIQQHGIGKHYYAVCACEGDEVHGRKNAKLGAKGTLTDYLLCDKKSNHTQVVEKGTSGAKEAVLDYAVIKEEPQRCLLDITLHTGRQHQIRAQLSHHGYPIIGDRKYGIPAEAGVQLALCSYRIRFLHPSLGEQMEYRIVSDNLQIKELLGR